MNPGREGAPELGIPGAALVTLVAVVALQLLVRGAALVGAAARHVTYARALDAVVGDPVDVALVQAGAFAVVLLVALRMLTDEPPREALALRPVAPVVAALALLAGVALQLPLAEVGNVVRAFAPDPEAVVAAQTRLLAGGTPLATLAVLLCVVVVAPVTEELLFRGLLLPALARRHGAAVGLVVSSLLFGVSHVGATSAVVYATLAGLVLGAVALRTRSTLAAVALHAAFNALPVLVPARVVRIPGFNVPELGVAHVPAVAVVLSAAVAVAALYFLARVTAEEDG